ncbi:MAG: recombinase family protein [Sphingobium sp.]
MSVVRCAIYTRKSSDEGLEQDFNSLDAQREACAAYILSQASEGWTLVDTVYDDGGISGGTLERPALRRLLADIEAGHVDIIVVYKVDRLTRSLLDFAKLVEAFDRKGISFVSVTQSFNTTTSMGRLTLNMLLSFAQFEREVTAERIRDKLAASKAKGMWMGGMPPLGYRPDGRSLSIIDDHADIVRAIYAGYLNLGTVRELADHLKDQGIASPRRTTGNGRNYGGGPFSRGQLYQILKNPIYTGHIAHRRRSGLSKGKATHETKIYPGNHPAIISQDQWDTVQAQLKEQTQGTRRGRSPSTSLLAGLLVDEEGEPLIASHACKPASHKSSSSNARRRYRYYVSKQLVRDGAAQAKSANTPAWRIPARAIEQLVIKEIATLFADPLDLAGKAELILQPADLPRLVQCCDTIIDQLKIKPAALLQQLIERLALSSTGLHISIRADALAEQLKLERQQTSTPSFTLTTHVRLTRTGHAMRLIAGAGGSAVQPTGEPHLIKLLIRARRWWQTLSEGEITPTSLATREGVTVSYLLRVVRLAFLSPTIVTAIIDGTLRADVDATKLLDAETYPFQWREQEAMLLPN